MAIANLPSQILTHHSSCSSHRAECSCHARPDRPRIQHLPSLKTPALFVHGTRDPFGSIEEMQSALKLIPAKTKLLPVNNAGHDLGFKGKSRNEELPGKVLEEFSDLLCVTVVPGWRSLIYPARF